MRFSKDGVFLADVPNSGVVRRDPNARSGNPNHDARSGKFGGGGPAKKRTPAPANVDPREFARMRDAIRDAARQFAGDLNAENLQSFINKRASNPSAVNIQQFAQLVQQQQLDDLVDVLGNTRGKLKLSAPRGYVKKVLAGMSDDDIAEIVARLESRGIKNPHIIIGKSIDKERRDVVKEKHAALAASNDWTIDEEPHEDVETAFSQFFDPVEFAETFAKHIPQPQITVEPQITIQAPPPQPMKSIPVRDEKTGLILYTIQEPVTDGG